MSQPKIIPRSRFPLLVLSIYALSIGWSGAAIAAPWDDLLKKATDAITDVVDNTFDKNDDYLLRDDPFF